MWCKICGWKCDKEVTFKRCYNCEKIYQAICIIQDIYKNNTYVTHPMQRVDLALHVGLITFEEYKEILKHI
jgi:hypothetical protein